MLVRSLVEAPCISDPAARRSLLLPPAVRSAPGPAAMGDGWRNRFMAPVYALGISFLFVFVLGFWFGERQTVIQFQTPQPKKDATVTAFPRVFVVVSGKEQSDVIVVGMLVTPGEFSFPSSDKNVRVCLDVPSGWSIAPPLQTEVMGGLVCLSVTPDQNNIDVVLSGPGS